MTKERNAPNIRLFPVNRLSTEASTKLLTGDRVCSKQLYEEALGNLNSPADWETRAICEIMNTGIAGGIIQGWAAYKSPKRYKKYGSQKGWERVNQAPPEGDGFQEITEEEARQMELPF